MRLAQRVIFNTALFSLFSQIKQISVLFLKTRALALLVDTCNPALPGAGGEGAEVTAREPAEPIGASKNLFFYNEHSEDVSQLIH